MRSHRANGRTTGAAAPFCPGGRNVGTRCCAIEELDQVSRLAAFRQHLEECLEYPGATEPPEPLPYAVPFAIVARKCAPRYAVHSEVVDGFQELTVIMPWLAPARLRRIKHFQHDRPIALRHSRQHVRLPDAGHAVIRTKPDSGICQKRIAGIPSTRPREVWRIIGRFKREPLPALFACTSGGLTDRCGKLILGLSVPKGARGSF